MSRDGSDGIGIGGRGIVTIVIGISSLCAHSLVYPGEQFVFGNDHPLSNGDGGKVLGVHQRVCVGAGDTEHGGYIIGVQRQRELIVRSVSSCYSVSFQFLRKLEKRKNSSSGSSKLCTAIATLHFCLT